MASEEHAADIRLALTALVFEVQHQSHDCVQIFQYQTAHADPAILEAYCYTSRISYEPGEILSEWVNGLRLREAFTETITRTVVRRLAGLSEL